jgi:methylenetetrahydrofolate dehydrogenase (NADP+) / methenyltetrahydrofolate cyclohydrolase
VSAELLDGRPVARVLRERARAELARFRNTYGVTPGLAVLLVGDDPSSAAYRDAIIKVAASVELPVEALALPASVTQQDISAVITELNARDSVNGFLVLQPLPPHLSRVEVADLLDPLKDIDGITTFNAGRLFHDDRDVLAPSTPTGGMALLKHYNVPLAGQHAVVLGRSPIVGKPMAALLLAENATVTTCHSRTRNLAQMTRQADILVSAVGRPGVVTGEMVKPGATVVDFGVNFVDGQMVGDIDAASVAQVAGRLTPVPGGTGRVTTSVLIRNTIKAATLQQRRRTGEDRPPARVPREV